MPTKILNNAFLSVLDIKDEIQKQKNQGKVIVTTNGCFDIIHAGHILYLNEAARLGDILIVGVNCDLVVRKLKGEQRPIQNEQDRLTIVASLRMVDYAFIFRENDPRSFIEVLRPHIHVKGGDYSTNIIEKETVEKYGGRVEIVNFLEGRSTSKLVEKIKQKKC